jgi:GNAT superfamily N-acetyltransferase
MDGLMQSTEHINGAIPRGMKPGRRELGVASVMVSISDAVPEHMRARTREVSHLHVPAEYRRKHLATALMNLVCQEADANSITLLLIAQPYDEGPDEDQLIDWYAKFGFQMLQDSVKGTIMVRKVRVPSDRLSRAVSLALVH